MIPHIWSELPPTQKVDLAKSVRAPLVYANVFVKNWRPWVRAGVGYIYAPQERFSICALDFPVSFKTYRYPESPDEPVALHMQWIPTKGDGAVADQYRAARREILEVPLVELEDGIRSQLSRCLGPYGFKRGDIAAIVVNRHPHGYASDLDLYGELSAGKTPYTERMRARLGRVAIANSDAGGIALLNHAIDQGHRAVRELTG
jgi:spermidine dehydrogenase